jgi:putative CocE/NonD family hydrolase
MWNEHVEHCNYDDFRQRRNLLPHLKNVRCAVMTVGGWYDAEDLYGALQTYYAVERQNPGIYNTLVMGPWPHGGWSRGKGDRLGGAHFGSNTGEFYQAEIELPFFKHFLKGEGELKLPEAYMFETGANRWRTFDVWPPAEATSRSLYLQAGGYLTWDMPNGGGDVYEEYVSDPAKPVPFTETITTRMTREYMTDDQRFAGRRPDVLVYQTEVLDEPLTVAGPITADLWASTSGTDSDWVVKVIDVFPPDADDVAEDEEEDERPGRRRMRMGGYQMMVRSEVIRGRFRNDPSRPEPFTPNEPTRVRLPLQDVLHTFEPGHRVMVQIQSTWFPLVDRNPQTFVDNIYLADGSDFVKATQRVYTSGKHATRIEFGVLPATEPRP